MGSRLFGEGQIGKVFKHDTNSGRVEVLIKDQGKVRGKVFVDSGKQRVPCSFIALFHTKLVCKISTGTSSLQGNGVYFNDTKIKKDEVAKENEGDITSELTTNLDLDMFKISIPNSWRHEKIGSDHKLVGPENSGYILVTVYSDNYSEFSSCGLLGEMERNLKNSDSIVPNKKKQASPEFARLVNAKESCFSDYHVKSASKSRMYASIIVNAFRKEDKFIVIVTGIADEI